jgi:hypothetical protein
LQQLINNKQQTMFNHYKKAFGLLLCCLFANMASAQTLVHYWHFNSLVDGASIITPLPADLSLIKGSTAITYTGTGIGKMDNVAGDVLNAQNGIAAGYALRPRNPSSNGSLIVAFPTTGYENLSIKFATTKTKEGATEQIYSYSIDGGVTFIDTNLPVKTFSPVTDTYSLVTLDLSGIPGADNNANFILKINFGGTTAAGTSGNNRIDNLTVNGNAIGGVVTPPVPTPVAVSLAKSFVVVNEDAGTLSFVLNVANPGVGSVDLVVKGALFSTANNEDFTLATQTIKFDAASAATHTITIPIIDDKLVEQAAEYFVLSLENAVGVTLTGETLATIYIKDNDVAAPVPNKDIALEFVTSFDPSGSNESTCEIVVFDAASKKLFSTSAVQDRLDIIDFSNPEEPKTLKSIDMAPYGGVTSVAVKNGVVAVASPNVLEHLDGSVVFFDTDGKFLKQVTVGALPDNISFTPDGTKVLTANEGQPNKDYTIDPEGSVSIIDISGGLDKLAQTNVTTLLFTAYNTAEAEAILIASGVRKLKLTSKMSEDFEPEYITTSADSKKAWVTLQENNAIAEINLETKAITSVWGLGTKDMSLPGNGFDVSDNNGEVLIANWPVKAYFIPDGVASYNIGGTNYIVTANEGDEKEYTGFEERTTIGAASYVLDATAYPQAAMLKNSNNAGRLRVTNLDGKNEAGAYKQIYAVGTRSFSIFNADTKKIVFDSGDDFEMYTSTSPSIKALFNADSEDNKVKGRSRAKGPEPEGVTIAKIKDKVFAFVGLERVGGVMVYDITNPADAKFVDYANSRTVSAYGGDNGPEGITYISDTESPNGKAYTIIANEISGTLAVYEVNQTKLGLGDFIQNPKTFVVFPNPSVDNGLVYFNRAADIEVYDYSGKLIQSAKQALTIDTSKMASGIYIVKTSEGIAKKLIIK